MTDKSQLINLIVDTFLDDKLNDFSSNEDNVYEFWEKFNSYKAKVLELTQNIHSFELVKNLEVDKMYESNNCLKDKEAHISMLEHNL